MSKRVLVRDAADDLDRRLAALRHRVDGEVLVPGDPGFRQAALTWNRGSQHDPAVIVVAEDVGDVIAAMHYATETDIGLGVRATGHVMTEPVDGVLLVTSRMDRVVVDAEARVAWIGAGCRWGPVLAAAQEHGLAPLVGTSSDAGVVGETVGCGLGWLARRYGPACDAVRSLDVVTPAGELVCASRDEHPALLRALRGGGGGASLGVVTEMEIQLFPVDRVYGGDLTYPAHAAPDVLARWSRWVADAPDELTSSVVLLNGPGGRSSTIVRGCWSGPVEAGRAVLDDWRNEMPPVVDGWGEQRLSDLAPAGADSAAPCAGIVSGGWLATPTGHAIAAEVGAVLAAAAFPADGPPVLRSCEVRHAGGAVATGPQRMDSSMANRDAAFLVVLVGEVDGHHDVGTIAAHQAACVDALGEHLSGAASAGGSHPGNNPLPGDQ